MYNKCHGKLFVLGPTFCGVAVQAIVSQKSAADVLAAKKAGVSIHGSGKQAFTICGTASQYYCVAVSSSCAGVVQAIGTDACVCTCNVLSLHLVVLFRV